MEITTKEHKSHSKMQRCSHCDEVMISALFDEVNDPEHHKIFCCHGCLTVYQIINAKGLNDYYSIKDQAGAFKRRSPVDIKPGKFLYLDDEDFQAEYSYINSDGLRTMEFYLEGIHCLACLWLIERLPQFQPKVLQSKLDLEKSIATVSISAEAKFSIVASEFNQLGYRPHPLKRDQDGHNLKVKEERQNLLRIGVAAAGTSNIMLYAVSIYAGASDTYANVFNALTVVFALPVLTYSASPFYKTAWNALKNKTLSIDIPIAIALLVGFGMGLRNLFIGVNENYFDSLTMLVFLLLLSRYFLKKIQERALAAKDLHYFYQGDVVQRAIANSLDRFEEIHPKFIKREDIIKVATGDFIPVDGRVIKGQSSVNTSLLTGESIPSQIGVDDLVFAGTQNQSNELIIKALKVNKETRLGEILKGVENGWSSKAPVVELTDRISKYFIVTVFALCAVMFAYFAFRGEMKLALEHALTLLIVTCPCALALATPLAFTQALSRCADRGIIIKNDAVLQKISNLRTLFVDKTGTITYGKMSVVDFKQLHPSKIDLWDIVYSLESKSRHPIALALSNYAKSKGGKQLETRDFKEQPGLGVSATIQESYFEINNQGLFQDHELIATFALNDIVREDSADALREIHASGLNIRLISGDKEENVTSVAKQINLPVQNAYSQLSPEQKSTILKESKNSMMVGDGANDAIALSHADVGVAVLGAMDISLRAADVFLATPGLSPIANLIIVSSETMKLIKRNLIISLLYNGLSVAAAFMGLITPLTAAIIMPISSLTVLVSTLIGTKKLRIAWKS